MRVPTAVIAEDEAVLRDELRERSRELWPELDICAEAADGLEALRALAAHAPDILFLDIQMPGMTGLEVARQASGTLPRGLRHRLRQLRGRGLRAGRGRLRDEAVHRRAPREDRARGCKERLRSAPANLDGLLEPLAGEGCAKRKEYLRWVTASQGNDDVASSPWTRSATSAPTTSTRWSSRADQESLIRRPIKELAEQLDPDIFWQIHRCTLVNVNAIAGVTRDFRGHLSVRLKQRQGDAAGQRAYVHLFRQM